MLSPSNIAGNNLRAYKALGIFPYNNHINCRLDAWAGSHLSAHGYFLCGMVEFPPLTDFTGRMFAYKSSAFRIATMGDEYPTTRRDGELCHFGTFSILTSDDVRNAEWEVNKPDSAEHCTIHVVSQCS
jgi:hypothetical protein